MATAGAPNAAAILAKLKKDLGDEIGNYGGKYADVPRLPFGIFPLDLALGGGIPMGKFTEIFGPESSNKTNMFLLLVKMGQMLYPGKVAVMIDAERSYNAQWAAKLGVDVNRLIVLEPEYAEQAVDIVDSFLRAPDVFMVGLDSIASLVTQNEIESSAEKAIVGGSSNVVGKMVRKVIGTQGECRKKFGIAPAFVGINQTRFKIGVMFGDPETTPGGNSPRFAAACRIRVYGKNIQDNKVNPAMPAFKEVNAIIRKWKFPILQVNAKYTMQMLKFGGHSPGFVEDWNTVSSFLKELDYLGKAAGGGWSLFGDQYKTLDAIREKLYGDPELLNQARQSIIEEMMVKGGIEESDGEIYVEDANAPELQDAA